MFQKKRRYKPTLEFLEDRYLLSGNVAQTNIVSDGFVAAKHTDSNLLNAWGIAYQPGGPFWVSDNNSGQSTFFDFNGTPAGAPVAIPLPSNASTGTAAPTGIVYNGSSDFLLNSSPGSSAIFIFATEDGTISGWNPSVNPTKAVLKVDNAAFPTGGAVYKGLAIGNDGSGNFLYAANFATGKIDVFNGSFVATSLTGSFTDPDPSHDLVGYAPFNIQNLGGQLYVTYAKQDAAHRNDVGGAGNGFVDVFDLNGNFVRRVTSHGTLNSPWGLALAPNTFSPFPGDLLVGNFMDGTINAFNPSTGAFLGQLLDNASQPIVIHGLWGLIFGDGGAGGPASTLYFSSGPNSEADGLFGSLTTVTITPGPASLATSFVTASSSTISVGGTTLVTLTARDADSNQEASGGLTVVFGLGAGSGTFSTVTDHGNGTYTATFTATAAGNVTVTATIGGQSITSTPLAITVTLIGPSGPSATDMPTFTWSAITGAAHYDLWISDLTTGQSPALLLTNLSGTTVTLSAAQALTPGDSFRWWTRGLSGSGTPFAWGTPTDFSVAPLGTPTPSGPSGTLASDQPAFSWSAVGLAAHYDEWVTDLTTGVGGIVGNSTTTSFTDTAGLTPGHSFRWWVRADSTSGSAGSWSVPTDFAIVALGTSAPAGPSGTLTSDQPTFNWSAVSLAAHYDVWVTDLTTGVGGIVGSSTTTSFTDAAGLTPGHSFRWWVRADSTNGSAGSWSVPTDFAIAALGTPTPAGPSGTLTTSQPTYTWSAVALANRYDLWLTDLTAGVGGIIGTSASTSLAAPAPLQSGHSYRWWVRAVSNNGTAGSWSAPTDFFSY